MGVAFRNPAIVKPWRGLFSVPFERVYQNANGWRVVLCSRFCSGNNMMGRVLAKAHARACV
jgi:hypothetical protein